MIIILLIIMVVFGAAKLPQIGAALGKSIREFKKESAGGEDKKTEAITASDSKNSEHPEPALATKKGF